MKTRMFVSILISVLTVLIVSGCATTPVRLLNSAKSGNYKWVKKMLEEGADVNTQDNTGATALIMASQSEDNK